MKALRQQPKYTLLYAEDDTVAAEINIASFQASGYEVLYAEDEKSALAMYKKHRSSINIILLDIMMPPNMNAGYDIAKEIRKVDAMVPILFLTCLRGTEDAIRGLKLGADDFIRKDIAQSELTARVDSNVRNSPQKQGGPLKITPHTTFDPVNMTISVKNETVKLTKNEAGLIHHFYYHMNEIVERPLLEKLLWGDNTNGNIYLNKCISSIRSVFRGDDAIEIISYKNVGVKFGVKEQKKAKKK